MKLRKLTRHQKSDLVLLGALIILSLTAYLIPYFNLDVVITKAVQSINLQVFSAVMQFVTSLGNQPLMVFIVITSTFIMFLAGWRREAVISSLSTATGTLLGTLVKEIVNRPRPSASLVHVSSWLADKSFPSGHTLAFTIYFGFLLYLILRRARQSLISLGLSLVFMLLIATIGLSRVYLGVHWASDVLGGYLFGLFWLSLTIRLYNSHHGQR